MFYIAATDNVRERVSGDQSSGGSRSPCRQTVAVVITTVKLDSDGKYGVVDRRERIGSRARLMSKPHFGSTGWHILSHFHIRFLTGVVPISTKRALSSLALSVSGLPTRRSLPTNNNFCWLTDGFYHRKIKLFRWPGKTQTHRYRSWSLGQVLRVFCALAVAIFGRSSSNLIQKHSFL